MPSIQTSSITKTEFDGISANLIADLFDWYSDLKDNPDAPLPNPSTAGAFENIPDIDSKSVVQISPITKKYLGINLDVKMIRKGGYNSFDDFTKDILPKLREACPIALLTATD